MATTANLSFLPWIREGAAGAITTPDTLTPKQAAVADVSVVLKVNSTTLPEVPLRLRGPADVVGIDRHQIVRTDPRPDSTDFEPNCFPSIEFDRADFPWLFTPARANGNGQLRPWLSLVVVRRQDGVQLSSTSDAPLPVLRIAAPAKPFVELPDLRDSWAWAHGQAAADPTVDPNSVRAALNGAPHLSLSRLVCPRLLTPNTDYLACVVPAFELGRKAGLGLAIADTELTAQNALAPAWTLTATAPTQVTLPVFYSWRFRSGEGGDFETLARRLRINIPAGLGQRTVAVGLPGFTVPGLDPAATVQAEGALMPLKTTSPPVVWGDLIAPAFELALANIVNQPGLNQIIAPSADPLLAPPVYGRWHAGRAVVTPKAANWLDALNLDPRWRTAAALGTDVIQTHQEALMASAWEQAARVQPVNQRLRQLQMSMAVGESLHARHLMPLGEEMTLRFASPVFGRIRVATPDLDPAGRTLTAVMAGTSLPVAATRTAMRRIGRQRGPLSRRIVAKGVARSLDTTWIARINFNNAFPAPPLPTIVQASLPPLPTVEAVVGANWNSGFRVAAENQPMIPLAAVDPLPAGWDYPGDFRKAAADHLARVGPRISAAFIPHITMASTVEVVRTQMAPRAALARLARAAIATGDNVLPSTAPGVTAVGTETVMMEPSFPQPMYEALKEKSQDLLLPGLDKVLPDTVLGLRTNRAFVESYMIGLNVEMARELLWRGFPTDQRGTYFRNFWGNDGAPAAVSDIGDLRLNLGRELGASAPGAPANQFVLLLRSALLRRYPNAIIYLTPAVTGSSRPPDVYPIFNGAMEPDVNFVGFPIAAGTAIGDRGNPGYYVVIQEHPTEPRFGLDEPVTNALLATKSHLPIGTQPPAGVPLKGRTWGRNSAHMAEITRRLPVRITIHASQLVSLT
jgi:hypothetical protein